jgi:hypothetical protein
MVNRVIGRRSGSPSGRRAGRRSDRERDGDDDMVDDCYVCLEPLRRCDQAHWERDCHCSRGVRMHDACAIEYVATNRDRRGRVRCPICREWVELANLHDLTIVDGDAPASSSVPLAAVAPVPVAVVGVAPVVNVVAPASPSVAMPPPPLAAVASAPAVAVGVGPPAAAAPMSSVMMLIAAQQAQFNAQPVAPVEGVIAVDDHPIVPALLINTVASLRTHQVAHPQVGQVPLHITFEGTVVAVDATRDIQLRTGSNRSATDMYLTDAAVSSSPAEVAAISNHVYTLRNQQAVPHVYGQAVPTAVRLSVRVPRRMRRSRPSR